MKEVATIAQAFFDVAAAVTGIAKVEFITQFSIDELKHLARTPLLLISPHMMYLTYGRRQQRGTQLMLNTFLISHNRRGERAEHASLEIMWVLDDLDAVVVDNDFDLAIHPFDIYRREAVEVEKGLSVIRTIYATVIYGELAKSKFTYLDSSNVFQTIEFYFISTSFQTEEIKDNNDYDWVLDGSLKTYSRTPKKRYELRLTLIPTALREQLLAMKTTGGEISFYRDKDANATMACFWVNDFNFYEERAGRWTGSIILHET
jgi:hypothetical protein